jgi:hypothetical protein
MERLMSLNGYVRQLKPRTEKYISPVDKAQNLLSEAYTAPISSKKDITKFLKGQSDIPKGYIGQLEKLLKYLKKEYPLSDGKGIIAGDPDNFKIKIRAIARQDETLLKKVSPESQKDIDAWIKTNAKSIILRKNTAGSYDYGQGTPVEGTPDPKGADWENLITDKYNEIVGGSDSNATDAAQKFYPTYGESAVKVATSFNKTLKMKSEMTQYGGGGGKKNLSSSWKEWGGTNGTPKTDMFTSNYNISLKKAGGSQLASGGAGETISTFYAALEYMGEDRGANKDIDKIMTMIENNFTKIKNKDLTAGLAKKISTGKVDIGSTGIPKSDIKQFETGQKFHKELNKEITKNLSFEKNPIFRKWYTFEAMSGYKKFSNQKSIASICVEFNPDTGAITKNIPVTPDGKSNFGSKPKVSSEVESISQKIKIFAAWKTAVGEPASVLRALPEETDTFRGIILNELRNDKVVNKVITNLNEEMEQLDEFAIIRKAFNKVKGLTSKATTWLNNLFVKIMKKVKAALEKIKQMGAKLFEKLFEFFNIAISAVKESFPSDLHGFIYGMSD